jgi:hypothetical protein
MMKVFVVVLVLGFPAALVFSWAFEITPEGIVRESEIEPTKSMTRRTGRKIVAITVVLAIIAAGLLAFQMVGRDHSSPAAAAARRSGEKDADRGRSPAVAGSLSVPEKSIAVLPFDNLSRDPENAYFADGIQDEVLSMVAKIGDLKVIPEHRPRSIKASQRVCGRSVWSSAWPTCSKAACRKPGIVSA